MPVIPVAFLRDVAHAVPVAEALVQGGVPVIEMTLRTPGALRCVEKIATHVPEILVGAGTIVSAERLPGASTVEEVLQLLGVRARLRAAPRGPSS